MKNFVSIRIANGDILKIDTLGHNSFMNIEPLIEPKMNYNILSESEMSTNDYVIIIETKKH